MARALVGLLVLVCAALGCSDRERSRKPQPRDDASLSGREFRPPTGKVRAVPPHNIHAGGVGPYRLGAGLQDVLGLLPHGPRVELMQIEGLVDYRLVRAERDALVIGVGRRGGVQFVSVLDPEIARTESGVGVGASPQELAVALGAVARTPGGGRDPRLIRFSALPGTRFVVAEDAVVAAVVTPRPEGVGAAEPACDAGALAEHESEIAAASQLREPQVVFGCFGDGAAALAFGGDRFTVVSGKPGAWRREATRSVSGLVFAAPVDTDGDGHHEIAAVTEDRNLEAVRIGVELHRVDGSRLVQLLSRPAFAVTATAARWVGAALGDIELLVEVRGGAGELELSGLYLHRVDGALHSAVPLEPVVIQVRDGNGPGAPRGPEPDESEAATEPAADAGPDAAPKGKRRRGGPERPRPDAGAGRSAPAEGAGDAPAEASGQAEPKREATAAPGSGDAAEPARPRGI